MTVARTGIGIWFYLKVALILKWRVVARQNIWNDEPAGRGIPTRHTNAKVMPRGKII